MTHSPVPPTSWEPYEPCTDCGALAGQPCRDRRLRNPRGSLRVIYSVLPHRTRRRRRPGG